MMKYKIALLVLLAACMARSNDKSLTSSDAARTKVFFYPSAYVDQGRLMDGVMATSLQQVTALSPVSDLFDGLLLMVPWSILEPEPGMIRYDILDRTLEFWHERGKTVILNIGAFGFRIETGGEWGGKPGVLTGWTPEWVMERCRTHEYPNARLLYNTREERGPTRHPDFRDENFVKLYSEFIAAIGKRYDGDPRIEYVRAGTGMMGEEHPLFAQGPENLFAGYTHELWYGYVKQVLAAYLAAFPNSRMALDLSWAGHPYQDEINGGRQAVESVLDAMAANQVVLGYNGWGGLPLSELKSQLRTSMGEILRSYRARGGSVALETGGPPGANNRFRMQDTEAMLDWCRELNPVYVNFMGHAPAVVNMAMGKAGVADGPSIARYVSMCLNLQKNSLYPDVETDHAALALKYLSLVKAIRETPAARSVR